MLATLLMLVALLPAETQTTTAELDRVRLVSHTGGELWMDLFLVHDDMVLHFRADEKTRFYMDGEVSTPEAVVALLRNRRIESPKATVETEKGTILAKTVRVSTKGG